MYNEFKNHEKADSIKWIAVFVAIAILFVGVVAALIPPILPVIPKSRKHSAITVNALVEQFSKNP